MPHPSEQIQILCVDDHRVVLEGIASLIGRQPDMLIVGFAATAPEAVQLYRRYRPDVTLMDLQLPEVSGLEAIRRIRSEDSQARIIVLTMYHGEEDIYRALEAGATTYLLKDALSDDLVRIIRDVHAGGRPIPSEVTALLAARSSHPTLSPREVDVVHLISEGLRNKEIALALGISEETVKVHVKSVLAKLGVRDRAAVVGAAIRRGILHIV